MGSFLPSDMGIFFQSQLKLEPFVILFSYDIVVSVNNFLTEMMMSIDTKTPNVLSFSRFQKKYRIS